jgi:hypothetical protein
VMWGASTETLDVRENRPLIAARKIIAAFRLMIRRRIRRASPGGAILI